ncbi:MAG: cell wall hydrolase [Paracoccaceae bacterium]
MLLLALAGGLHAEVTVSQSNDPNTVEEQGLLALMFQEKAALGAVSAARVEALTRAPKAARGGKGAINSEQLACLSQVLYHEARGETPAGQQAVAEVVLNRVDDPAFPNTVCGVVYQSNTRGCQFSWTCDGRSDKIRNANAYAVVETVARDMLSGAPRDLTDGATYFHTPAVKPGWSRKFTRTTKIGAHIFYRKGGRVALN